MADMQSKSDNQNVYIVYTYNVNMRGATKYVDGIYLKPEDAVGRQKELIPDGEFGINGSRCGRDKNGYNKCSFVNVFPLGSQHTESHTTSIPDWHRFV